MSLTGLPIIFLTGFLALLAIAVTVLLWSRFGRWRLLSRTAGVLLGELLVVLTLGLVFNRADGFYPSWQALAGETGTASQTARPTAGRLDATLGQNSHTPWQPAGVDSWRLTGAPTVVFPPGYRDRPSVEFPVVLVLADTPAAAKAAVQAAQRTDGVVTVVATPTAATTAAELGRFGADLIQDVRVTRRGWALVTTAHGATLAAGVINGSPGQYAGEALIGPGQPAGVRLTVPVSTAVIHAVATAAPGPGKSVSPATTLQPGSSGQPGSSIRPGSAIQPGSSIQPGMPLKPGPTGQTGFTGQPGSEWQPGLIGQPKAAGPVSTANATGLANQLVKPGLPGFTGPGGNAAAAIKSGSPGKSLPHPGAEPHANPAPRGNGTPGKNAGLPAPLATPGKGVAPGKALPSGGVVTLTCPRGSVWAVALHWAAEQTSRPLQPAIQLPVGKP